jgi:hypothetical protein
VDFDGAACPILGSWGFFAANISFDPTFSGAKGAGSWAMSGCSSRARSSWTQSP